MHLHSRNTYLEAVEMAATSRMVMSKVTARHQTTLPSAVRKVLGLGAGSHVGYEIIGQEVHLINPDNVDHNDPALDAFLGLLTTSIATTGTVRPVPISLLRRAMTAAEGVAIDHDAPMHGAIEL
jgi:antitoxin PrlF